MTLYLILRNSTVARDRGSFVIMCVTNMAASASNLDLSTENPTERNQRWRLLRPSLSSLLQPSDPLRQSAHKILSSVPLTGESSQVLDLPLPHKKLKNIGVVPGSVNSEALGDCREVLIEVLIRAVEHQVGRHGYFLLHHVGQSHNSAIRVNLKELLNNLCVGCLVALFVRCNRATDLCQFQVAVLFGLPGCVPVGYECSPLLKRSVDETKVRVVFCFWVL